MKQPTNYIEQLLNGARVEWKALGEVAKFRRGSFPQPYGNSQWYNGEGAMPFVQVVDVGSNMKLVKNTKNKISKLAQSQSVFVPKNTVIITLQGSIGRIAITQYDAYVDRTIAIFEEFRIEIDKKYFAYQLEEKFRKEKENARGSTIKTITKEEFKDFLIPIPPLSVQKEIVRILDSFTELTAELTAALTAELSARKLQYSYYRERLLSFGMDNHERHEGHENVVWKTLGKVAEYSKFRINSILLDKNNYVGVDNLLQNRNGKTLSTYVPKTGNSTQYNINDILIGNIRPYLKKIWHSNQLGGTNGDVLVIRLTDKNILPRFLYQLLADDSFFDYNMQHAKGAKMPRGDKDKIMEYKIPIPSLEEQERIVSILDKFDTLTTSISEGLPREIALRKQQYEYYRDLLLTF